MRALLFLCLLLVVGGAEAAPRVQVACLPDSAGWPLARVQQAPEAAWKSGSSAQPFAHGLHHEWCRLIADDPGSDGLVVVLDGHALISIPKPVVVPPPHVGHAQASIRLKPYQGNFSNSLAPTLRIAEQDERRPYYLYFEGLRPPDTVTVRASSLTDFYMADRKRFGFDVAMLSAMAILGLIAAIFAVQLGRVALLYLCVWVAAVLVLRLLESGVIYNWVSISDPLRRAVQSMALTVAVASSTLFAIVYLQLRPLYPLWTRLLWGLVAVMSLAALSLNFFYSAWLRTTLNTVILLQFLVVIALAVRLAWRGDASARFFMIGWAPVLLLSIIRTIELLSGKHWPLVEAVWQITLLTAVLTLLIATSRAARYAEREMHVARQAAHRDTLTGLPNRSALQHGLAAEIASAVRTGRPLSVLFLDIDHFKAINDRHGHDVGDDCLRHFARIMQARLRTSDLLVRLGGEEFVVVMPGTDLKQAQHLAEELRAALVASPMARADAWIAMTMSIGAASWRDGDDVEKLLKRADVAVYAAKDAGRDRVMLEEAPAP